jgi:HD-GYP domain-containing protein (c-di-GMP phosphodiesterase class II)
VFEALTAADRPYKDRKTLSQSLRIMSFMVKDNHLDRGLYDLFLDSGVYQDYAEKFLLADQIDEVDVEQFRAA